MNKVVELKYGIFTGCLKTSKLEEVVFRENQNGYTVVNATVVTGRMLLIIPRKRLLLFLEKKDSNV